MQFEDLEVWKRARKLCPEVYKAQAGLKVFGFRDQITRAGLSIPSNIAEGFERESVKECISFLSYAKGSCGELRTQVYIGMDTGYLAPEVAQAWIQVTREISSMLKGLVKTRRGLTNKP